jgi:hypothetical protein
MKKLFPDIKKCTFRWWQHPLLWFIPIKKRETEDGIVYFKIKKGKYYIYGIKVLNNS